MSHGLSIIILSMCICCRVTRAVLWSNSWPMEDGHKLESCRGVNPVASLTTLGSIPTWNISWIGSRTISPMLSCELCWFLFHLFHLIYLSFDYKHARCSFCWLFNEVFFFFGNFLTSKINNSCLLWIEENTDNNRSWELVWPLLRNLIFRVVSYPVNLSHFFSLEGIPVSCLEIDLLFFLVIQPISGWKPWLIMLKQMEIGVWFVKKRSLRKYFELFTQSELFNSHWTLWSYNQKVFCSILWFSSTLIQLQI